MTYRTFIGQRAIADIKAIVDWYGDVSPSLSDRFVTELDRVLEILSQNPMLGKLHIEGLRRFPLREFPFFLWYLPVEESRLLYVIGVRHFRGISGELL